jgi:hypothetical protein
MNLAGPSSVYAWSLGASGSPRRPLTTWKWTLIGGLSIPLWATWPALLGLQPFTWQLLIAAMAIGGAGLLSRH